MMEGMSLLHYSVTTTSDTQQILSVTQVMYNSAGLDLDNRKIWPNYIEYKDAKVIDRILEPLGSCHKLTDLFNESGGDDLNYQPLLHFFTSSCYITEKDDNLSS